MEKLKSDFLTYLYNDEKTMEIVSVDVQYFAEYDIENVCHLSPAWVFTCRKESNGSARYSAKHNEIEEIIEVSSQANERLLNFWIKVATFAVIFILLVTWVLWPLPLYRNWIFTKAYFNGYVTVGLIWLYSTLLIVGIWPLWVGRRLFMIVARGLIHDYRQAKSNRWKKQELPLPESLAVSSGNETLK